MGDFYDTVESRFHDWHYDHPKILYGFIRSMKPAVIVEVGTYRGYAACYMAKALQENNTGVLVCIDNFTLTEHVERYGDPEAHWEENLTAAGVRDWVTLIKGDSDKVEWPAKVDMAYVDGWHSYAMCRRDVEHAMSLGAEFIAIDDVISCVGPRQYFAEMRGSEEWDTMMVHRDAGMGILMRRKPIPRVLYIQERSDSPGVGLQDMTTQQAQAEIDRAAKVTGLTYKGML